MNAFYYVGYFNHPWNDSDFVIMAQTASPHVAHFIMTSYNEAYERNGMSSRLRILDDSDLPDDHRYSLPS